MTAISTSELQAIKEFHNNNSQDARRWWNTIELALSKMEGQEEYEKTLIKLVDVKLCGDAARWADDTSNVAEIIEKHQPNGNDVAELKRLFLNKFRKAKTLPEDINKLLDDLRQAADETLDDYYERASKIVNHVCRDGTEGGVPRSVPIAEAAWIQQVLRGFAKGMTDRWIGFHVGDEEHKSVESAYNSAKEHMRQIRRQQERAKEWEREGFQAAEYMPSRWGSYGTHGAYMQNQQQTAKTDFQQTTRISTNNIRQGNAYGGYTDLGANGQNTKNNQNIRPIMPPQDSYGRSTYNGSYTIFPNPQQSQQGQYQRNQNQGQLATPRPNQIIKLNF